MSLGRGSRKEGFSLPRTPSGLLKVMGEGRWGGNKESDKRLGCWFLRHPL